MNRPYDRSQRVKNSYLFHPHKLANWAWYGQNYFSSYSGVVKRNNARVIIIEKRTSCWRLELVEMCVCL